MVGDVASTGTLCGEGDAASIVRSALVGGTGVALEANDKLGVYVAKDLWRAIRHNLDAKVTAGLV